MGNDGGSIPTRRELVKEAARNPSATEIKESQHSQQEYYWSTDPLSRKPLSHPIVSDCNGKLYNKDAVLEYLLPGEDEDAQKLKAQAEEVLQGSVKSLKDVVEVNFEIEEQKSEDGSKKERYICPVTRDALGAGGAKAIYLVPCGHAFSATAIKEVSGEKCLQCDEAYAPNDVIPILPTGKEEIARLSLRVQTLKEKGLAHSLKKASGNKKRKKGVEADATATAETTGHAEAKTATSKASTSIEKPTPSNGINNASTATLTKGVLAELSEKSKKRKMNENANLKSLFSNRDQTASITKSRDFMSRGFTIPAHERK